MCLKIWGWPGFSSLLLKMSSRFPMCVMVRDAVVLFLWFFLYQLSLGETLHLPRMKLALQKHEAL